MQTEVLQNDLLPYECRHHEEGKCPGMPSQYL